jgi:hypothetical protein
LNFFFFPISLIRVALNKKISATVAWMQMSAPNVSLYALTIMAQPSFQEEHPDINDFQRVHRQLYLPCMHFLFALALVGMLASLSSLWVRWNDFKKLPFSPAHAAFCVPTLSHANAIQAYRGSLDSFSTLPAGSPFRVCLYTYWVLVLAAGTIVTCWISVKFLYWYVERNPSAVRNTRLVHLFSSLKALPALTLICSRYFAPAHWLSILCAFPIVFAFPFAAFQPGHILT